MMSKLMETKTELIQYVRDCGESNDPEVKAEVEAIVKAIQNDEYDSWEFKRWLSGEQAAAKDVNDREILDMVRYIRRCASNNKGNLRRKGVK